MCYHKANRTCLNNVLKWGSHASQRWSGRSLLLLRMKNQTVANKYCKLVEAEAADFFWIKYYHSTPIPPVLLPSLLKRDWQTIKMKHSCAAIASDTFQKVSAILQRRQKMLMSPYNSSPFPIVYGELAKFKAGALDSNVFTRECHFELM